jgi:hypothetical protein
VCGNATSASALYIFEDTLLPTVVPPADITVECGAITTSVTEWQDGARAADDCGSGFTFEAILFNTVSGCGESMTEVYQFTATDACGNQATALASYTIVDTTEPSVSCPSVLALECGSELNDLLIIEWLDSPVGADGCGDVTFEDNYAGTLPVNCGGRLQVVFTGMDACGNEATCTSSITMDDTGLPDFVNCPDDLTINVDVDECGSNPIFSTPVAVDNCSVMVVQTEGIASGNTFPVGTTAIEFTATDECGNTALCQFDLTVEDSDVPLVLCPSNTVVACADEGLCIWSSEDVGPTLGLENCENSTLVYAITGTTSGSGADDASGTLFALGASTICYTLTDASGNASSCCFDVLVEDCQAPGLTCPADLVVECDGLGNASDVSAFLAGASGSDNCQDQPVITNEFFNTISECGGGETTVYQFTATDEAGNTTLCTASMRIIDRVIPELATPAVDLTVECAGGAENNSAFIAWLNNNGGATATDVCSDIVWSHNFTEELTDLCGSTGARTVTFTARDACGNPIMTTAVFRIRDSEDPLLVCPQPIVLECNDPANEAIISNWLASASATDACSEVEIAYVFPDVFTTDCGDTGEHTVTFEAADECGNDTNCVSTIRLEDNIDPVFDLRPSNLMLECADPNNANLVSIWLANNGGGIASDLCSTPVWMVEEISEIPSCGSTSETVYLFTITDDCNNTNTAFASVITENTTAPILSTPTELTVECDGSNNLTELNNWLALADGSSDCGSVSIENQLFNTISDCGGSSEQVYLFTATDQCGNQSTALSSFIIEDTTDPTPVCPPNLVLECGDEGNDQAIAAWLLSTDITDGSGCSEVILSNNYNGNLPTLLCSGNPGTIVQFTATDACGNSQSCQALITINDTTAPLFANCPTDITVNVDVDLCSSNVVYSQPVALDQCDLDIDIALTSGLASGTTFPLGTTAILFTAVDECGNGTTCTFNITVEDSDIPEIDCPSNRVVVCTTDGTCMWEANEETSAIFSENCEGAGFTITYAITGATTANSSPTGLNDVDSDNVIFNLGVSEVCYTITDEAGNSDQCCFDLVVEDCQDPEIVCPADLVVECDGAGNSVELADWLGTVTGTDNCDASVELSSQMFNTISGCGDTQSEIYAFTVTDDFGNTNLCYAEFRIEDTTVPTIDIEAVDLTLECNGTGSSAALTAWLNNQAGAMASDLCGEISWTHNFVQELDVICDGNSTTTVTFTATDNCGNESTTTAVFTIEDTVDPFIVCPEDITLECAGELNDALIANWLDRASAEDGCSGVTLVNNFGELFAAGCGSTGVHNVIFTAEDACNNLSVCEGDVTIMDESSPEIISEPIDLILECAGTDNATDISNWETSFGGAVATDACSSPLIWTIISTSSLVDCGSTSSSEYTFQVTDDCGNTSTTTASVIIEDTTPPELVVPEDQVEECNAIAVSLEEWRAEVTGSDACGAVAFTSVLWNTTSGCGGTESLTYLFTATDACGNSSTGFASYGTEDTQVPTPVCPANLLLTCGSVSNDQQILSWLNSASATDAVDCSEFNITNDYPGDLPELNCNGGVGIEINFIATDACGNSASCSSTITMEDNTPPIFSNCPLDMMVNVDVDLCSTNVVYSQPIALDACDAFVEVALIEGVPSGMPFPLGLTTVTFESIDECGNTSICTFDITVVDSDVPSIACPSNDVVVCTDSNSCTWIATDQIDPIYNDNCPGQILTYNITGATTAMSGPTGVNEVDAGGEIFILGRSTVLYTITDPEGNVASCEFDVVVEDCEDPTLTCVDVLEVACDSEDLSAWFNTIAASIMDNCSAEGEMVVDTLLLTDFSSCGNTFDRVYQYRVTDAFGNFSQCIARYETIDEVVPDITDATDLTVECADGSQSTALLAWLNNNGGATATDVCSEPITWTNDFVNDLSIVCGSNGRVEVVFTATDDCGNFSTTSAVFTIEDTTAPVLTCPDDISLECSEDINVAVINNWLRTATALDACQGITDIVNNYPGLFAEGCGLTGVHTVTFATSDDCGSLSSCQREIIFLDRIAPEIIMEAEDLELSCSSTTSAEDIALWLANNAGAEATDACSDEVLVWTFEEIETSEGCGGFSNQTYVFTVTDNCGNTSTTEAMVVISDDTHPDFDLGPQDLTINCDPMANAVSLEDWLTSNGGAIVSDECASNFTWTYDLVSLSDDCGNTSVQTYRFTVSDECGNSSTAEADFVTTDAVAPVITKEAENFTAECNGSSNSAEILSWLNNNGFATAEDLCGSITWTNDYGTVLTDCGTAGGVTVIFTATDECGNSSTTSAVFTINDTTDPIWTLNPQSIEVECDGSNDPMGQIEAWLNTAGGGEAEDDCSAISYTHNFSAIDLECDMEGGVDSDADDNR